MGKQTDKVTGKMYNVAYGRANHQTDAFNQLGLYASNPAAKCSPFVKKINITDHP